ncbi:hypothetical protein [Gloeobacter morelensis]|uniref:Glycosyltransferase RgtA/B/C/D-like domain-containing protein n=1 Tax=Gloeobacter morelensis MG652769 TaxID=2781736 RepID=A0ABY3PJU4_9CYAN|nr:hypothetical protein [Gloeobacter morelensis]UFP93893.1 hypothetical protein ISF26_19295 [Gloeobacter morelensis MG652769]
MPAARLSNWLAFVAAAALWLALQAHRQNLGIAWEDSYHHWLIAAHLARTGILTDPLTSTSNGWLPVYHWLAGGWLAIFGWHNLTALQTLSALFSIAAAGVLAWRWGVGAACLFLFNPITVLGGSLSVAEPLAVLLVVLGAVAWQKDGTVIGAGCWSLVALTDRGCWPLVLLAVGWQIFQRRPARLSGWGWLLLPVAALGLGLFLTQAEVGRTAAWAAVDQAALPSAGDRWRELVAYSWRPLALPLLLALAGTLAARREALGLGLIAFGYLATLVALVTGGALTGSSRYYLVLVALLAALASTRPLLRLLQLPAVAVLLLFSFQYLQLWPRWVILNQPSELAGRWLASHSSSGILVTDSPVIAYFSRLPPERIAGGKVPLPAETRYIAAIVDGRYRQIYPLLRSYPELAVGALPAGWRLIYQARHWSERYGGKPVRVFTVDAAPHQAASGGLGST